MYTCLSITPIMCIHEDEDVVEAVREKKHLLMYKQIYYVNRWLYIHHQNDEEDFSLYFFTLTDVCDLAQHYFASLLIKYSPKVEGDRVYMSMTGYRYIRLQTCTHQLEQAEGVLNRAYASMKAIIVNEILRGMIFTRSDALNIVQEIQAKYSVMMSVENILVISQKYNLLVHNVEYIGQNGNCSKRTSFKVHDNFLAHENCAILKYFR